MHAYKFVVSRSEGRATQRLPSRDVLAQARFQSVHPRAINYAPYVAGKARLPSLYSCGNSTFPRGSPGADPGGSSTPVSFQKLLSIVIVVTVNLLSEFRYYQLSNSIIQQLCLLMKLKS